MITAVVALGVGGWLWVRDSSLVAVRQVAVTGVDGPDAPEIRSALITAARTMTTLNVNTGTLHTVVAPFPVVRQLRVSTSFPHGLRIHVIEQVPVAVIIAAGRRTEVAADGTLLRGAAAASTLPAITLSVAPGGNRVTGTALAEVKLLAAAPYALLVKVSQASSDASRGLVAALRDGPTLYFGEASDLSVKWTAAAAVLDDPGSAGAAYIDISDPARPAAGGGTDSATTAPATTPSATGPTATTPTATTPIATTPTATGATADAASAPVTSAGGG